MRESICVTPLAQLAPDAQTAPAAAASGPQGSSEIRIVAVIAFVAASIRRILFEKLAHTAPPPAVKASRSEPARAGPSRTVATTLLVAGSMRETVGPPAFATQTAPGVTAIATGYLPTGMVAVTPLVDGSMRKTVLSPALGTQTAPLPAAGSPHT